MRQPLAPPAPVAFQAPPTLQDVIRVVNANTERFPRLQTDNATLTAQGFPALRANLAVQRPRSLRVRAQFVGLGQVLDLGSNDALFWALVDSPQLLGNQTKVVYYARHDQFQQSPARQLFPFQPDWLIEALGLVQFAPTAVHEGPYTRTPGRLEIRTRVPGPGGDVTKVYVLDATYGWVLEQHLYNPQGQLLASAFNANHRYYPEVGGSLPHRVAIYLPAPGPSFQIDVQSYAINQLYSDPAQLFAMPNFAGYQLVDLANPNGPSPSAGPAVPPPAATAPPPTLPIGQPPPSGTPPPAYPSLSFRPRYRGYTGSR